MMENPCLPGETIACGQIAVGFAVLVLVEELAYSVESCAVG
jgi:hypothetical protein